MSEPVFTAFYRTCQECMKQTFPLDPKERVFKTEEARAKFMDAYYEEKCPFCKSPGALDHGTRTRIKPWTSEETDDDED